MISSLFNVDHKNEVIQYQRKANNKFFIIFLSALKTAGRYKEKTTFRYISRQGSSNYLYHLFSILSTVLLLNQIEGSVK